MHLWRLNLTLELKKNSYFLFFIQLFFLVPYYWLLFVKSQFLAYFFFLKRIDKIELGLLVLTLLQFFFSLQKWIYYEINLDNESVFFINSHSHIYFIIFSFIGIVLLISFLTVHLKFLTFSFITEFLFLCFFLISFFYPSFFHTNFKDINDYNFSAFMYLFGICSFINLILKFLLIKKNAK